ncbi:hypothetical protein A4G19_07755 [Pasteurellaceae bacterium Macca]|nr:hypothetical protein [Pasteurellaceae bacterium Macca]
MHSQFPQLLQESWNFIRNHPRFALTGVGLLIALQLAISFALPKVAFSPEMAQNPKAMEQAISLLAPTLLSALVSVLVNIILVLNIKSINDGLYHHFFQNIGNTLKALFPVIALMIFMALPLSIGVSFGGTLGQASGVAIMVLPLMITGIYVFVKLCLVVYAYLIESPQKGVIETLKFTWGLSRGKMGMLFLFCLISNLFPSVVTTLFLGFGDFGELLSLVIGAFLSLFMVVFSFRFYQVFRQLPRER